MPNQRSLRPLRHSGRWVPDASVAGPAQESAHLLPRVVPDLGPVGEGRNGVVDLAECVGRLDVLAERCAEDLGRP